MRSQPNVRLAPNQEEVLLKLHPKSLLRLKCSHFYSAYHTHGNIEIGIGTLHCQVCWDLQMQRKSHLPFRQLAMGKIDAQLMPRGNQRLMREAMHQILGCVLLAKAHKCIALCAHDSYFLYISVLDENVVQILVCVVRGQVSHKERCLVAALSRSSRSRWRCKRVVKLKRRTAS